MSYILEALKKSQQERELGQVPTLDTGELFSEDRDPNPPNYWGLLAVGLAALAVAISLYAALKPPAPARAPALASPQPPRQPAPATTSVAVAQPQVAGPELVPKAPASEALAPLVEAPPPKRPAHTASPAPRVDREAHSRANDAEAKLERQMDQDRSARGSASMDAAAFEADSDPPPVPVPRDLIEDVERFKQQLRRDQGEKPRAAKERPPRLSGDLTRLRLTPDQQAMLPAYLMTAHVYDVDRTKRFVVINSLKYREDDDTREGLRVERIVPQGTVLSFGGNPFFVPR